MIITIILLSEMTSDYLYVKQGIITEMEYRENLQEATLLKYKSADDPISYRVKIIVEKLFSFYHFLKDTFKFKGAERIKRQKNQLGSKL